MTDWTSVPFVSSDFLPPVVFARCSPATNQFLLFLVFRFRITNAADSPLPQRSLNFSQQLDSIISSYIITISDGILNIACPELAQTVWYHDDRDKITSPTTRSLIIIAKGHTCLVNVSCGSLGVILGNHATGFYSKRNW